MSIHFRADRLTAAEVSFLRWQYGFEDGDDPFSRALWQAIGRAYEADSESGGMSGLLGRLGAPGAFPEEVALYRAFRSERGDALWEDLLRRAGLSERRQASLPAPVERRRRR